MWPMQTLRIHRPVPGIMRPWPCQGIQRGRKLNRMPILGG